MDRVTTRRRTTRSRCRRMTADLHLRASSANTIDRRRLYLSLEPLEATARPRIAIQARGRGSRGRMLRLQPEHATASCSIGSVTNVPLQDSRAMEITGNADVRCAVGTHAPSGQSAAQPLDGVVPFVDPQPDARLQAHWRLLVRRRDAQAARAAEGRCAAAAIDDSWTEGTLRGARKANHFRWIPIASGPARTR